MNYLEEFQQIVEAYKEGDEIIQDGSLIINGNSVVGKHEVEGLHIETRSTKEGVEVRVSVDKGVKIEQPIHLCFGMTKDKGRQVINSEFIINDGASAEFLAHCSFPNAIRIEHIMGSKVEVGKHAKMSYLEEHYHSDDGNTLVQPKLRGIIHEGGQLKEEFKLVKGKVGTLDIDYEIRQLEHSSCELLTKVFGKKKDKIKVRESISLDGAYASGVAKSRIVLLDDAKGEVLGEISGNAPYTKGHVDCHEVVQGENAIAISKPQVMVNNPLARITHEAALGRINRKELETLMARGLDEDEAVEFIVNGMLK